MTRILIAVLSLAAAAPLGAAGYEPPLSSAPAGGPATRYCLRVAPITGSNVETVQCWTRIEWADEGVDVDQAWAKDGVSVIG